jgi:hypothetical protein
VSNTLGAGCLEKVYQRALLHELRLRGIRAAAEVSFPVTYKGHGVAQHVMAVNQFLEHAVQFAAQPSGDAHPENVGHLVGGQAELSHLAGVFEDLVNREVPLEDEVPAPIRFD